MVLSIRAYCKTAKRALEIWKQTVNEANLKDSHGETIKVELSIRDDAYDKEKMKMNYRTLANTSDFFFGPSYVLWNEAASAEAERHSKDHHLGFRLVELLG